MTKKRKPIKSIKKDDGLLTRPGVLEVQIMHDDTCPQLLTNGMAGCTCKPDIIMRDLETGVAFSVDVNGNETRLS